MQPTQQAVAATRKAFAALAAASHHSSKLRLRLRTQSALQQVSHEQRDKHRADTRTTLIRAACWYPLPFSACQRKPKRLARRHKECCKH
jgi:hypothetical protein